MSIQTHKRLKTINNNVDQIGGQAMSIQTHKRLKTINNNEDQIGGHTRPNWRSKKINSNP
jgi:hypothetical protein